MIILVITKKHKKFYELFHLETLSKKKLNSCKGQIKRFTDSKFMCFYLYFLALFTRYLSSAVLDGLSTSIP